MSLNNKYIIAKRIAEELEDGQIVNLGIGIPTLVTYFLDDKKVFLQTENRLLKMGPQLSIEKMDIDLMHSVKDHADSDDFIRESQVDVAVLGALQVSIHGEMANWAFPNQSIIGVSGAVNLLSCAKKVIVAASLFAKDGTSKLVDQLTYTSNGFRKVELFVSDYAVFTFTDTGVKVVEILKDLSIEELSEKVGLPLEYVRNEGYFNNPTSQMNQFLS